MFTRRAVLAGAVPLALRGQAALKPQTIADLEKLVGSEMAAQGIPGMSLAIAVDGNIWSAGYGTSDLENFVPAKATTVYRTASVAKPITGVAAMQLAERGKLDLDAPVQTYVPWFPVKPWRVSTRLLLGHLAGIRTYRNTAEAFTTTHYATLSDAVRTFADDPLVAEPGTRYVYSTLGYVLAGLVIEYASGMSYMSHIRRTILEPAGMKDTRPDDVYALIPNRARGYQRRATGEILNAALADTSLKVPGGGLCSTALDLVRFVVALDRGKLLKPASTEEMLRPLRLRDGKSAGYGLGWGRFDATRYIFGHNGGQAGVTTALRYLTKDRIALAVMANLEQVQLRTFLPRLIQIASAH